MAQQSHPPPPPKKRLAILVLIVAGAILIATLWPFNFFPANRVHWLVGTGGIGFGGRGVVVSKAVSTLEEGVRGTSFSLELSLRPSSVEGSDTILGLSTRKLPNRLLLKQWTDGLLVIQDTLDSQGRPKRSKFDVDHAFQPDRRLLLTLASGPNGTTVYLNGRQAKVFPRFVIPPLESSTQIVLGTAPEDYQPWSGEVSGLAIYSNELTASQVSQHYEKWTPQTGLPTPDPDGLVAFYPFAEGAGREIHNKVESGSDLEIPEWFRIPRKPFLKSPKKEFVADWDYVNDVVRNIVGFVPLGFLACAYWRCSRYHRQAILLATLSGALLSLIIEVLQFFIPSRNSGVTDIITNTSGTAIGALLAGPGLVQTILKRLESSTPPLADSK